MWGNKRFVWRSPILKIFQIQTVTTPVINTAPTFLMIYGEEVVNSSKCRLSHEKHVCTYNLLCIHCVLCTGVAVNLQLPARLFKELDQDYYLTRWQISHQSWDASQSSAMLSASHLSPAVWTLKWFLGGKPAHRGDLIYSVSWRMIPMLVVRLFFT